MIVMIDAIPEIKTTLTVAAPVHIPGSELKMSRYHNRNNGSPMNVKTITAALRLSDPLVLKI